VPTLVGAVEVTGPSLPPSPLPLAPLPSPLTNSSVRGMGAVVASAVVPRVVCTEAIEIGKEVAPVVVADVMASLPLSPLAPLPLPGPPSSSSVVARTVDNCVVEPRVARPLPPSPLPLPLPSSSSSALVTAVDSVDARVAVPSLPLSPLPLS